MLIDYGCFAGGQIEIDPDMFELKECQFAGKCPKC
jgi:hypothetical protein